MPRRRLTQDERELWNRVARTATRLRSERAVGGLPDRPLDLAANTRIPSVPDSPVPKPTVSFRPSVQVPRNFPATAAGNTSGSTIFLDLAESLGDSLARQPVRMDRNLHKSMRRGKLEPEARIDLHGMTAATAHQALSGFILSAHARDLRLILVITGKGRTPSPDHAAPMPARAGVLRHEVPHWLHSAPLAPLVMELRESHRSHGGSGAYYVYLRKRR